MKDDNLNENIEVLGGDNISMNQSNNDSSNIISDISSVNSVNNALITDNSIKEVEENVNNMNMSNEGLKNKSNGNTNNNLIKIIILILTLILVSAIVLYFLFFEKSAMFRNTFNTGFNKMQLTLKDNLVQYEKNFNSNKLLFDLQANLMMLNQPMKVNMSAGIDRVNNLTYIKGMSGAKMFIDKDDVYYDFGDLIVVDNLKKNNKFNSFAKSNLKMDSNKINKILEYWQLAFNNQFDKKNVEEKWENVEVVNECKDLSKCEKVNKKVRVITYKIDNKKYAALEENFLKLIESDKDIVNYLEKDNITSLKNRIKNLKDSDKRPVEISFYTNLLSVKKVKVKSENEYTEILKGNDFYVINNDNYEFFINSADKGNFASKNKLTKEVITGDFENNKNKLNVNFVSKDQKLKFNFDKKNNLVKVNVSNPSLKGDITVNIYNNKEIPNFDKGKAKSIGQLNLEELIKFSNGMRGFFGNLY